MSLQRPSFFNALADRVVDNGFTVIPTNGKKPAVPRWQNPRPTDRQWLGAMLRANRYAGCNLGIVCGRVVGIDIDADEPEEALRLEALAVEHLGPTPFQRVGRAPRTLLLYRPELGEAVASVKLGGCIDVLSGGRQFVAFGIHPDTGKSYRWIARSPETAKLDELPVITAASIRAFADALAKALGGPPRGLPAITLQTVAGVLKTRQRTRQSEMFASAYDSQIVRGPDGRVMDGRDALMAKLTAAEYAKGTHSGPIDLANRIWSRFLTEADMARPKGSNPRRRWSRKDAAAKARAICGRSPDLVRPRRSRKGHPASHLNAWRKARFWTEEQRELSLVEAGRRITTPAVLAVARVMIEAVELQSGFCTLPITEIAKRASCSAKSVTKARAALVKSGLWIAGAGGTYVPIALNADQAIEKKGRDRVRRNVKVPALYHPSVLPLPVPYQPDMFGGSVVDFGHYHTGRLPADFGAAVRAEMRARGTTQEALAGELGISQPQLANALAGRFGLSRTPAERLIAWLERAA
jgi:hypothetical protein